MTRPRSARRPLRLWLLSAAISSALLSQQAQAQSSPFARRGTDPGTQAAQAVQRQSVLSAQAAQMAQKSLQAFQRAAQLRSSLDAAQAAARAAAAASQVGNDIPDGLAEGGLQVVDNVRIDPGAIRSDDPRLSQSNVWLGAKAPAQTSADGRTTVTIEQTQKKAILNWETFNVGKNTTVRFDQSAGGNEAAQWIALNRINDPSTAPSRIFGGIEAQGQVYLLNRNGVLFGGTSQVNTHSLLVSSLNLFSDVLEAGNRQFLQNGLTGGNNGSAVLGVGSSADGLPGDILIAAGARIGGGSDGYVLAAAPNIGNAGTVTAKDGQVLLAAVTNIKKGNALPPSNGLATGNGNTLPFAYDVDMPVRLDARGAGTLDNQGAVISTRGDVTLVGYDLRQHGLVQASTSISRTGSVNLLAIDQSATTGGFSSLKNAYGGKLELGPGSVTTILPERDGETTNSTAAADQAFVAPSANLVGAQIHLQPDSMLYMPGAALNLYGLSAAVNGRRDPLTELILVDDGATVSVAGLPDVQLEIGSQLVTIPRVGENELADTPLQRNGPFYRQPMTVDARLSGIRADGSAWIGSPLINAGGYVEQVPRTIDQLLIDGGDISIAGSDVAVREGAELDLDGGYLHYLGGIVETRRVLGADGRLYDLDKADPNRQYLGYAGDMTVDHARWNVQETYSNPLLGKKRYYESDYLHGGDAGALRIQVGGTMHQSGVDAPHLLMLDGQVLARAESGRYQLQSNQLARGGTLELGGDDLIEHIFIDGEGVPRYWKIDSKRDGLSAKVDADTPAEALPGSDLAAADPANPGYWSTLSTELVRQAGFESVEIEGAQVRVESGANLQVRNGGSIAIDAQRIEVDGALIARSGNIELHANDALRAPGADSDELLRNDIVLGANARLDVSGLWINDDRRQTPNPQGDAFIDGGRIELSTMQITATDPLLGPVDRSGSIRLAPGAVLDASSGGRLLPDGTLAYDANNVPLGRGGDISLKTYLRDQIPNAARPDPFSTRYAPLDENVGLLDFQHATLLADGFAGGGTLSLRAMGLQIGGGAPDDARVLHLSEDFFERKPFGGYDLSAELDATIAAGAQVDVSQRQFLPDIEALRQAATGTRLFDGLDGGGIGRYGRLDQIDAFRRPAADFSLRAGDFVGRPTGTADTTPLYPATGTLLLDRGAALNLDAGGDVRLGSRGQLTVLGDITARGGSVTLSGDTTQDNGLSPPPSGDYSNPYFSRDKSVWIGAESRLDVSGISLLDPQASLVQTAQGAVRPRDGRVLDGGEITLGNDGGYVIVEQGAQLDLSGARDDYQLPTGNVRFDGDGDTLQSRQVWSDGGTLTLAASGGLYFDGGIAASGGAAQARGGTLSLLPLAQRNGTGPALSATGLILHQSGSRLPEGLRPGEVVETGATAPSGLLYFAADRLDGSGIDTLQIGNLTPGSSTDAGAPLLPIGIAGDVKLRLNRAIQLNAPEYRMLAADADGLDDLAGTGKVELEAAYVGFNGYRPPSASTALPTAASPQGDTALEVRADHIDIGGQVVLSGIADAQFDSQGDIRFHTPGAYGYAFDGPSTQIYRPGELSSAGNLNFRADQLYPASGQTFIVRAVDPQAQTSIRILPGGASSVPLSAGGNLLFDASVIEQGGTVRAPGGRIVLGVGDVDNPATRASFNQRSLVQTEQVSLLPGSLTSVSLNGATIPYGTTVDGGQWHYDLLPVGSPALTAPPEKQIVLASDALDLRDGARVDLSGGGELQAVEWVAGTGGSRDVLSPYNTRYSGSGSQSVPLYPDERGVYAIVPGMQSPVAASDAVFDRTASPVEVGQAVHLSGVPGLPDGVYTLLPARYATLPGAYRVVQRNGALDSSPAHNTVAADGTAVVAGHYVDALTGARDARSTTFEVQPQSTWRQDSEYVTTPASAFFGRQAEDGGTASPQLPNDAGRLVLAATQRLDLGAQLNTAAAGRGAAAQIDIASRAVQIRDGDHAALDGHVQLDVGELNALGAGSLLIGGTRERTSEGTRIDAIAQRVVVSNDAGNPLAAPEILLVAIAGDDADDGVRIDAGSAVQARGEYSGRDRTLIFGREEDAAASGDGALLRVSNAGEASIVRHNVPEFGHARGSLSIGDGALLDGGESLTLDSSGQTRLSAEALLRGKSLSANAGQISFVADGGLAADGMVIGPDSLAQFADAQRIGLRSYGRMDFLGNIRVDVDQALNLSAGVFAGNGGDVQLRAGMLTLSNELGAATAGRDGGNRGGTLSLQGREVVFGEGDKSLDGFGRVAVDAGGTAIARGRGRFDFGTLDVELHAPLLQADASADNTLATTGTLTLRSSGAAASAISPLGGTLTLQGGRIDSDLLIRANAGTVELHSTDGDLHLRDGAMIDVSGTAKSFYDIAAYAPGGEIALTADRGRMRLDAGATLDFSAAAAGGDAGSLNVSARLQDAELLGTLDGHAPKGEGGAFALDVGGSVALDALSRRLADSGIERAVSVRTRSGNLALSTGNVLRAHDVELIADGGLEAAQRDPLNGNIVVDGVIDASGESGGLIALWGRHGIAVDGTLDASGSAAEQRGGAVALGTGGRNDGTLNAEYGYQNVQADASGRIAIGAGATIDVSGGSAGGLSGGTVDLRAPLLADGDVNVHIAEGARIDGAREVGLEAYAVWSTTDASTDPGKHFDGIVDPAGWYDAQGQFIGDGIWTDRQGNSLPAPSAGQLADYLSRHFYTPGTANEAHRRFYGYADDATGAPGTLMGFAQRPGFTFENRFAHLANFRARPGIELRNPDPQINGGEISVLTDWNLGSGASRDALDLRYGDIAPALTLRAEGGVMMKASLSDGFYQANNPFGGGGPIATYPQVLQDYENLINDYLNIYGIDIGGLFPPPPTTNGSEEEIAQYYGQYRQLLDMLTRPHPELNSDPSGTISLLEGFLLLYALGIPPEPAPDGPQSPPLPTSPTDFADYLNAYERYLLDLNTLFNSTGVLAELQPISLPVLGPLLPGTRYNTPSLQARIDNPLPLATMTLTGGDSSRYRIVAGADFAATSPSALRAGSSADIVLDGHRRYQEEGQKDALAPNLIRTGTGSIELAAARDLRFADANAPASIYTAGRPVEGTTAGSDIAVKRSEDGTATTAGVLVSAIAYAEAAGDVVLHAGRDILGNRQLFDSDGSLTGIVGNYTGQFWWPWLQTANVTDPDTMQVLASPINFGGFAQGVMSVGGDIEVVAGRDIVELSVSAPTSYDQNGEHGGGDIDVHAGRDVLSSDFYVARGDGRLSVGGRLGSSFGLSYKGLLPGDTARVFDTQVDPVLALQDGQWSVQVRGDASLGAIVNPRYLGTRSGTLGPFGMVGLSGKRDYGDDSAVSIAALNGDLRLNTQKFAGALFGFGSRDSNGNVYADDPIFDPVLPASLRAISLSDDLSVEGGGLLFPSADGQLQLIADGDIRLYDDRATLIPMLQMLDIPVAQAFNNSGAIVTQVDRDDWLNLHRDDDEPARIYSLGGDIRNGYDRDGYALNPLTLSVPKAASIRAGRDIVNLDLRAQHYRDSDVSLIHAGRDYYNTPLLGGPIGRYAGVRHSFVEVGGAGLLDAQAGRDFGPITSALEPYSPGQLPSGPDKNGLRTIGNRDNAGLPAQGADLSVRYGVENGIAIDEFAGRYIDPSASGNDPAWRQWLIDYMLQIENDRRTRGGEAALASMSGEDAWQAFRQMPVERRQPLVDRVFLDLLGQVGEDYNDPASPYAGQYARGYEAIETLFPSELGYTPNNLQGGGNGAADRRVTGVLDMRGATLQTQRGGDIRILGPGGDLLVGSSSAPPLLTDSRGNVIVGPNQQGILAMGEGDIGVFTDADVVLAQSRIFTQRGGDLTIWSSNGDINAGRGVKTSTEKPRVTYICDNDHYCYVDLRGQVSGAGIATLQTVPGAEPGDAVLIAPRGTVDAGDAGIRVSGNLIVAAQHIANADNIQVQGDSIGVPSAARVDTGALSAASSAASSVGDAAEDLAQRRAPMPVQDLPAIISVQVIGLGNCAADDPRCHLR